MEKHVGQSSALQEIDRWSSCKFSTAGKHSVYANQTVRPFWLLCRGPNFTLRDRGVNARLA